VKITVIATGFGAHTAALPASAAATTPVDMSIYADHARTRTEIPISPAVAPARLSIARRPLLDLPVAASSGAVPSRPPVNPQPVGSAAEPAGGKSGDTMRLEDTDDYDMSTAFDVPAFLRRQES
jgi:hypothetical protein